MEHLESAVKFIINSEKTQFNLIYKDIYGHDLLMAYKIIEDKKYFVIIDSLGYRGKSYELVESKLIQTITENGFGESTFLIANKTQRQKDFTTCTVFVYKDLKALLENPDLINQIVAKTIIDNKTILKSVLEQNIANYVSWLPNEFKHLIQANELIQSDEYMLKYISEHFKIGYGVVTDYLVPTNNPNAFNPKYHPITNRLSTYFKEKYLTTTLPKMLKALTAKDVLGIIDQYELANMFCEEINATGEDSSTDF